MKELLSFLLTIAVIIGVLYALFHFLPVVAWILVGAFVLFFGIMFVVGIVQTKKESDPNRAMIERVDALCTKLTGIRSHCMGQEQVKLYADLLLERTRNLQKVVHEIPYSEKKVAVVEQTAAEIESAAERLEEFNLAAATMDAVHIREQQEDLDRMVESLQTAKELLGIGTPAGIGMQQGSAPAKQSQARDSHEGTRVRRM